MSMWGAVRERVLNEPAMALAAVSALLVTAQEFGLDLTDGQETSLNILTITVLGFLVRRQVVPMRQVELNPAADA